MKATLHSQEAFGEKSDWEALATAQALSADVRYKHQGRKAAGLMVSITVASASALSFTPKIETVDVFGNVILLWAAAAAVTANGTVVYVFAENGATDMNGTGVTAKALMPLPREWQLFLDFTAGSATFSVAICYL